jgi:ribosome biogenesis protein YTM1
MDQETIPIPSEVFCVFKTTMSAPYKLPETPISVSIDFTEATLSQLINQLLTDQNDPEDPISLQFEFLIKDDFLRGNLKSHIMKHAISSETNLVIHYCLALNKPKLAEKVQMEDWISVISPINEIEGPLLVGSFTGGLRLYGPRAKELLGEGEIKGKSLNAMKVFPNFLKSEPDFSHVIYSGHSDESLRISFFNSTEKNKVPHKKNPKLDIVTKVLCKGHNSSIEALDSHPLDNSWFASGAYDGELILWRLNNLETLHESEGIAIEGTRKKIKVSPIKELKPFNKNKLHHDKISEIIWQKPESLITGSFDHSIKVFDIEKSQESASFLCRDTAVTGLGILGKTLISGHEDGYIKLWDFRDKTAKKLLKSHGIWISKVRPLENNETIFASAGYDKNVKIWDIRSEFPLFSLKSHNDKVFCLEWNGKKMSFFYEI